MYQYPPLWLRIRAITLTCISLASFLWTIFLCFCVFYEWDAIPTAEQSLTVLFLIVNAVTILVLLILLLLPFRSWLDAARCMFLLICHIGVAGAIAYWSPKFQCTTTSIANAAFCRFTASFVLVTSWVIPALIIIYVLALAFVVYRVGKLDVDDEESAGYKSPETRTVENVFTREPSMFHEGHGRLSGHRWMAMNHSLPTPPSPTVSISTKASARLSKPIRIAYH